MLQCILRDGSEILASDVKSKVNDFLCPYCKTEITLAVSRSENFTTHFRHHKSAPKDCPGRVNEKLYFGPRIISHITVYTHGRITQNPGGTMSYSVAAYDEDDNLIYSKIDFAPEKYTSRIDKFTNATAHQIALNEGLEAATVLPHSSITIYTSCETSLKWTERTVKIVMRTNTFGMTSRWKVNHNDGAILADIAKAAYSFLHEPIIKWVKKDDNRAAKDHSKIMKKMIAA